MHRLTTDPEDCVRLFRKSDPGSHLTVRVRHIEGIAVYVMEVRVDHHPRNGEIARVEFNVRGFGSELAERLIGLIGASFPDGVAYGYGFETGPNALPAFVLYDRARRDGAAGSVTDGAGTGVPGPDIARTASVTPPMLSCEAAARLQAFARDLSKDQDFSAADALALATLAERGRGDSLFGADLSLGGR